MEIVYFTISFEFCPWGLTPSKERLFILFISCLANQCLHIAYHKRASSSSDISATINIFSKWIWFWFWLCGAVFIWEGKKFQTSAKAVVSQNDFHFSWLELAIRLEVNLGSNLKFNGVRANCAPEFGSRSKMQLQHIRLLSVFAFFTYQQIWRNGSALYKTSLFWIGLQVTKRLNNEDHL